MANGLERRVPCTCVFYTRLYRVLCTYVTPVFIILLRRCCCCIIFFHLVRESFFFLSSKWIHVACIVYCIPCRRRHTRTYLCVWRVSCVYKKRIRDAIESIYLCDWWQWKRSCSSTFYIYHKNNNCRNAIKNNEWNVEPYRTWWSWENETSIYWDTFFSFYLSLSLSLVTRCEIVNCKYQPKNIISAHEFSTSFTVPTRSTKKKKIKIFSTHCLCACIACSLINPVAIVETENLFISWEHIFSHSHSFRFLSHATFFLLPGLNFSYLLHIHMDAI